MLFDAESLADGRVRLGPLTVQPRKPAPAGRVKLAVRPEAWALGNAAGGLAGTVSKSAYLTWPRG